MPSKSESFILPYVLIIYKLPAIPTIQIAIATAARRNVNQSSTLAVAKTFAPPLLPQSKVALNSKMATAITKAMAAIV